MIDVRKDGSDDCCGDIPGACQNIEVHKGSEDASYDESTDDVVWGGHGVLGL